MLFLFLISLANADELSYNKDIKLIFESRCKICHSQIWPDKNWMDYEKAKENAEKIKVRVFDQKTMPPPSLPMEDKERELIRDWVLQGAKE